MQSAAAASPRVHRHIFDRSRVSKHEVAFCINVKLWRKIQAEQTGRIERTDCKWRFFHPLVCLCAKDLRVQRASFSFLSCFELYLTDVAFADIPLFTFPNWLHESNYRSEPHL